MSPEPPPAGPNVSEDDWERILSGIEAASAFSDQPGGATSWYCSAAVAGALAARLRRYNRLTRLVRQLNYLLEEFAASDPEGLPPETLPAGADAAPGQNPGVGSSARAGVSERVIRARRGLGLSEVINNLVSQRSTGAGDEGRERVVDLVGGSSHDLRKLLESDALAQAIQLDCRDPEHTELNCRTCAARGQAIDEYRLSVLSRGERPRPAPPVLASSNTTRTTSPSPVKVRVLDTRLGKEFPLPADPSSGAAGLALRACIAEPLLLGAGEVELIPTGLAVCLEDQKLVATLRPLPGHEHGIVLGSLVVLDSDSQSQLRICCWNRGREPFTIRPGDRIAQLVVASAIEVSLEPVETFSPSNEARAISGTAERGGEEQEGV